MAGKWLKKIGAGASAYMLAVVLLAASSAAVFYFVIASPDRVKGILNDSGAYGQFTNAFVGETSKSTSKDTSPVPFKNPTVQKAIKDAFSPEIIRVNTEKFIDGTYAWLDGETMQAEFTLDLAKNKTMLAESIGKLAQKRAAKLPACGFDGIPDNAQAFEIECLPPGITPKQIGDKTAKDLRSDKNFLPDTKITPDNIFGKDTQNNPFNQQSIPNQFQLAKNLLWLFLGLAVLLSVPAVFLSETRRKGMKRVARSLLVVGILTILSPLSFNLFSSQLAGSDIFSGAISKNVILPLTQEFISAISTVYYVFGFVCILIGGAGLVFAYKYKSNDPGDLHENERTS
jgi:hypothetical protein